jgi:hypothetical protein
MSDTLPRQDWPPAFQTAYRAARQLFRLLENLAHAAAPEARGWDRHAPPPEALEHAPHDPGPIGFLVDLIDVWLFEQDPQYGAAGLRGLLRELNDACGEAVVLGPGCSRSLTDAVLSLVGYLDAHTSQSFGCRRLVEIVRNAYLGTRLYPEEGPSDPRSEFGLAICFAGLPATHREELLRRRRGRQPFLRHVYDNGDFPEALAAVQVEQLRAWLAGVLRGLDFRAGETRLGLEFIRAAKASGEGSGGKDLPLEEMRRVIRQTKDGVTVKPDVLIAKANVRNKDARDALRRLQELGEYKGHTRRRPNRFQ